MVAKGANGVGRFSVEIEVANYGDLALMQRGLLALIGCVGKPSREWSTPARRSWCCPRPW